MLQERPERRVQVSRRQCRDVSRDRDDLPVTPEGGLPHRGRQPLAEVAARLGDRWNEDEVHVPESRHGPCDPVPREGEKRFTPAETLGRGLGARCSREKEDASRQTGLRNGHLGADTAFWYGADHGCM